MMDRDRWNATRSNLRKKAKKRVNDLLESLNEEDVGRTFGHVFSESSENNLPSNCVMYVSSNNGDSTSSSESLDEDVECSPQDDLAGCLREWATCFSISLVALSALLCILKTHHPSLPKDARSLLRTQTSYNITCLAGGSFYYFGVLNMFNGVFEKLSKVVPNQHTFKLQLNIDGLPIFKSCAVQFWPILGMLQGFTKKPMLIAIFCGNSKPQSLSEYLKDLVRELKTMSSGFVSSGKTFFLKLSSVVCDAPARAFIKGIKSHNGYSGCDKCVQSGVYINNRMTFPEVNAGQRTDVSFANVEDEDHHVQHSPLSETTVGMVSGFPHDYMHLVCLGVMRRLLDLWMGSGGPLRCRLSSQQVSCISDKLIALRPYIPTEFARRPRALAERLRWKATELRQFLLYTGPVILRDVLPSEIYQNFMLLSVSIYILASPSYCMLLNSFAETLLVSFVDHFRELYGHEFLVYNIHGLTHLCSDVKIHGHLDLISGFPFENYLKQLKKMVRKPRYPLSQVVRRLSELNCSRDVHVTSPSPRTELKMQHLGGPVPQTFEGAVCQFKELVMDEFIISTSERDCCIKINSKIVLVQNIIVFEGEEYIVCKEYGHATKAFDYPIDSTDLGICFVSDLSSALQCLKLEGCVQKCARLPVESGYVVIPLLHADS